MSVSEQRLLEAQWLYELHRQGRGRRPSPPPPAAPAGGERRHHGVPGAGGRGRSARARRRSDGQRAPA
ncbi:MAG: hypothetical protein QOG11_734 [Solirubrobacteraceae bacterium]|nr:hypothetical protein [Solirubrobacteraceae bacterium]